MPTCFGNGGMFDRCHWGVKGQMRGRPIIPDSHKLLRVIEIDHQVDPRWETFMSTHPEALIYHHSAWLQTLEQEYGRRSVALACEGGDGRLRGILPLLQTRGLPFQIGGQRTGRRLSSLPRTPIAGPLALDSQAAEALMRAAIERAQQEPETRLELKMSSPTLDGLVDGIDGNPWRLTYTLTLPSNPADLRFGNARNHGRIRWAVNKAARLGVQVRPAETEADLCAWYLLYLETMRSHQVPPRSYRFFRNMWKNLCPRGLMRLLLAEQQLGEERRLLAGSIFLLFGSTVFYAFNGRRRADLPLRPNDAIHWQAIQDACRAGFRTYDFGEVAESHQGLAEFKRKWGAEPGRLYRYYYPSIQEMDTDDTTPGEPVRQLANASWNRLPLRVTALLGDWLYRYL